MRRLPITVRLALAFALVMAVVLGVTGWIVYNTFASALDREIDRGLEARAQVVAALQQQAESGLREGNEDSQGGSGFAQVLTPTGRVVDSSRGAPQTPPLGPAELDRAAAGSITLTTTLGDGRAVRLLAQGVEAQDRRVVVVVGTSLAARQRSLSDLFAALWQGWAVALVLASLTGFGLATAALRPIESMRKRAAEISIGQLDQRLPNPPAHDEVGRLGATLNDMLARLEVAVERERAFIADASHELRTPLALLRTEIDLALDGEKEAAELERILRSAGDEVERLSRLADALLLFARLDRGALQLAVEPLDLASVVGFVRTRTAARAARLGRAVRVDIPAGMTLVADRLRLEQALDNLIDNALRYGGGEVCVSAEEDDGWVTIDVRDEGRGFPAEFLARAFERFTRAEASGGPAGSGIGLTIVEAVARAHGGTALATNPPTGGADVCLRLPKYRL